ncbi:chemotaxis protein CheW [Paenibacillus sp. y28]
MNDHPAFAYMGVFLDELNEQLLILDHLLLELELAGNNPEMLQTIFRAAHTLKGSSAAMGFERMKDLTHKLESVFDQLRREELQLTPPLANSVFRCVDYLKEQREKFMQGNYAEDAIDELLAELESFLNGTAPGAVLSAAAGSPLPMRQVICDHTLFSALGLSGADQDHLLGLLGEGRDVLAINVTLQRDIDMPGARILLIYRSLQELGAMLAVSPPMVLLESDEWRTGHAFIILAPAEGKSEENVRQELEGLSQVEAVELTRLTKAQLQPGHPAACAEEAGAALRTAAAPAADTKPAVQTTVRVDVARLERLLDLVGELIIDQTRLQEVKERLNDRFKNESEVILMNDISNHLGRVVSDLQDGIMKTRMLPIEQLFNRFPRLVRDLAQQANKEISFTMEGKETELDRTLIEEISDPIIHILRNAADHGLEPPEEREKLGKPRKGRLHLKASHQENAILISIADDGRGIDAQKIKQSSVRKGFVTQEEADRMSERELIHLIFRSGLSTADRVTELSGRGVGMDIVRAHIEKLNGIIEIDTTPGEGTVFTVKLPLTLAIIRSLLVKLGERTFAIPLVNVTEIIRLTTEDIQTIHGQEVCLVRGEILPLVRMHQKLHVQARAGEESDDARRLFVVIIGIAEKRVCLLVDRPLADREIVIKSMGSYVGQVPYVAGSTILGDGHVALILDVAAIIREAGTSLSSSRQEHVHAMTARAAERKLVTFMLDSEKYALDIHQVKEIIRVPAIAKMVTSSPAVLGIINLRGSLLPVFDLRNWFGMGDKAFTQHTRIIVMEAGGKTIGVLVDQVTEVQAVREDEMESAPERTRRPEGEAIRGVCNIGGRLVMLLQLNHLLDREEWMKAGQA